MRKWRHSEVKFLAQGHSVGHYGRWPQGPHFQLRCCMLSHVEGNPVVPVQQLGKPRQLEIRHPTEIALGWPLACFSLVDGSKLKLVLLRRSAAGGGIFLSQTASCGGGGVEPGSCPLPLHLLALGFGKVGSFQGLSQDPTVGLLLPSGRSSRYSVGLPSIPAPLQLLLPAPSLPLLVA